VDAADDKVATSRAGRRRCRTIGPGGARRPPV